MTELTFSIQTLQLDAKRLSLRYFQQHKNKLWNDLKKEAFDVRLFDRKTSKADGMKNDLAIFKINKNIKRGAEILKEVSQISRKGWNFALGRI